MNAAYPPVQRRAGPAIAAWWRSHVAGAVNHVAVVEKVREDSTWSTHYFFMTLMSAGIAILGLLLSSPAVVIGAMLISPLMGPILGLGFAIATFDSASLRRSAIALLLGVLLAVTLCALIVLASPLKTLTGEIAARTRPNLFDFLIALFSGLAGSYAMIRGHHGTIVGVAIATAIMPPLAVIGYGVATQNWTVLTGSALLFFTNLMTIAVTAAVLARLYGFASGLSPRQTGLQATLIVVTLGALAVPLGLSLNRIAWEALASRQAQEAIEAEFGDSARLGQVNVEHGTDPLQVRTTVFTPHYHRRAGQTLSTALSKRLSRPVAVDIQQFRVDDRPRDVEAAQVAAAQPQAAGKLADIETADLIERLALVAGVAPDEIVIDRAAKRALVRAAVLPDAGFGAYRALEGRLAATAPNWRIQLVPPLAALPDIASPSVRREALATAAWAASRLELPIAVTGGAEAEAGSATSALADAGVEVRRIRRRGSLGLSWAMPTRGPKP